MLTACHDSSDSDTTEPRSDSDQNKQSVLLSPDNKQSDTSSDETKPQRSSKIEENQPENTNVKPTEDLHEQLILELGFSDVQEENVNTNNTPSYCLDSLTLNNQPTFTENQICEKVSNRLASVSMQGCLNAKLKPNGCESVKGFPILTRSFLPVEGKKVQGKILIIGGTHADELTSVSTVFKWIEKLNKHHSGLFHWQVAPIMNPDGLFLKSATRTNHNGVDLNRNMPTNDWHSNAIHYWKTKGGKNPRRYPGKEPSSEPETQWLIDEINNFKPDAIISVHAPYGIVDFDSLLLKNAPKSLGKLHLNLLGTYPGSLGNYAGINRNIPVITVELPHAWEMPTDKETNKIWTDIVGWLKKNINQKNETNSTQ